MLGIFGGILWGPVPSWSADQGRRRGDRPCWLGGVGDPPVQQFQRPLPHFLAGLSIVDSPAKPQLGDRRAVESTTDTSPKAAKWSESRVRWRDLRRAIVRLT